MLQKPRQLPIPFAGTPAGPFKYTYFTSGLGMHRCHFIAIHLNCVRLDCNFRKSNVWYVWQVATACCAQHLKTVLITGQVGSSHILGEFMHCILLRIDFHQITVAGIDVLDVTTNPVSAAIFIVVIAAVAFVLLHLVVMVTVKPVAEAVGQ